MPQDNYERMPAVKIDIASLKEGIFIENRDQWKPNYIKTRFGYISRINIIGIIVSHNESTLSIIIDDGTGSILVNANFAFNYDIIINEGLKEGDTVVIIGRPRRFDDDVYITAEIINSLDNTAWLEYRKKEIKKQEEESFYIKPLYEIISEDKVDDEIDERNEEVSDIYEVTQNIIMNNDNGDGVSTDILEQELQRLNVKNARNSIQRLLEQGDLFEIRPGRLKLL